MALLASFWERLYDTGAGASYGSFYTYMWLVLQDQGSGSYVLISPFMSSMSSIYSDGGYRCRDYSFMFNTSTYMGHSVCGLVGSLAPTPKMFYFTLSGTVEDAYLSVVLTVKVMF